MRLRIRGPHAIVVEIAARTASRDGRVPKRLHEFQEQRFPAAIANRLEHCLGTGVVGLRGGSRKQRPRAVVDLDRAAIEAFIAGVQQAGMSEQVDQPGRTSQGALDAFRADDRCRRGHHRVGRVAGFARCLGGGERSISHQVHLRRNRNVEHRAVILSRDLMHQRQCEIGFERQQRKIEHGMPMHARHLRLGIHGSRARTHPSCFDGG